MASASEKLRGLDGAMTPGPWEHGWTPGYLDGMQSQHVETGYASSPPLTLRSPAHTEEIATVWNYLLPTVGNADGIAALRNALPLIADVVEWLEREHGRPHLVPSDLIGCRGCNALTALREHLEGSGDD